MDDDSTVEQPNTLRDRIRLDREEKLTNQRRWCGILREAIATGRAAGEQMTPTPMIVYTPKEPGRSILGQPDGGIDTSKPVYHVADGVCGFAWVELYPNTTETRKFVNWLIGKQKPAAADCDPLPILDGFGRAGKKYGTGYDIWIHAFDQSMQRKDCAARAIAEKLREGIPDLKAYALSRMD